MSNESEIKKNCSRPYNLGKRQATVDEKRGKIIEAARELILSENALAGFTLDAVAKQAGVARMTLYNQFGNKTGLLEALFDDIAERGQMFLLREVFQKEDPLEALEAFIFTFGNFWNSDRLIIKRLHAMAILDGEMAKADNARQERRKKGLQKIISSFANKNIITSEFSFEETVEIIQTLTSFETFDSIAGQNKNLLEVVPIIQKIISDVLKIRDSF